MKLTRILSVLPALSLSLVACGGSDDSGGDQQPAPLQGTVNQQSAKASAQQTITATRTAFTSKDTGSKKGLGVAAQLQGAASSSQGIITPAAAGAPTQSTTGEVAQAIGAGTCDCTDTKCSFKDCADNPGVTINGELAYENGKLTCKDLAYTVTSAASAGTTTITINCDIAYTDTSVAGTLSTTGATSVGGAKVGWSSSSTFNAVKYDATGKAVSGSVDVTASYSIEVATGQQGAAPQVYQGSASVTFP